MRNGLYHVAGLGSEFGVFLFFDFLPIAPRGTNRSVKDITHSKQDIFSDKITSHGVSVAQVDISRIFDKLTLSKYQFMHFTKLEQYALLLMGELAKSDMVVPLSLVSVSRRHGVSVPFLKKIVRSLRAAGLVRSKEGAGGGYMLARKPESISLWEIISSFDTTGDEWKSVNSVCPINKSCLPQHLRAMLTESIRDRLEQISLREAVR